MSAVPATFNILASAQLAANELKSQASSRPACAALGQALITAGETLPEGTPLSPVSQRILDTVRQAENGDGAGNATVQELKGYAGRMGQMLQNPSGAEQCAMLQTFCERLVVGSPRRSVTLC